MSHGQEQCNWWHGPYSSHLVLPLFLLRFGTHGLLGSSPLEVRIEELMFGLMRGRQTIAHMS
eukprot:1478596-Amphidinium_carterae.1